MFYDKQIDIYIQSGTTIDEYGIVTNNNDYSLINSLYVDIQPVDMALMRKDYFINTNISIRVYAPHNSQLSQLVEDKLNILIKHNNKAYKIYSLISWDDYIEMLLEETNIE